MQDHATIRVFAASLAVTLAGALAGCSGGGSSAPAVPAANAPSTPGSGAGTGPAPQSTQMNQLTSYTVFAGSADGTDLTTELSPLSTASSNGSGAYVAVAPQDLLTSGTPLAPVPVPGAYVTWPDGSVTVSDVLGNFDASSSTYVQNNVAAISNVPGMGIEVIVDPSQSTVAPQAPALDTYVDAYEPSGLAVAASSARAMRDTSAPPVLTGLAVVPPVEGMYDGEQRVFTVAGKDANNKRVDVGHRYAIAWSVSDCNGGTARGTLVVPGTDVSKVIYRAPKTGSSGTTCPDIVTASYTAPAPNASPSPGASQSPAAAGSPSSSTVSGTISASAKAYFAARSEKVVYAGTLLDGSGKPVAHGLVDFFSADAGAFGKQIAWTDAFGHFAAKAPQGRTIKFAAANRIVNGKVITYTWYAVNVTTGSVSGGNGATGLVLQETTQLPARP